jgi:large subunit ribosomal protein L27
MSKKKQGGKLKQQKRTQPKYLGVKVADGQKVSSGAILVRQRGTKFAAGDGVRIGRDHTLSAVANGVVRFGKNLGKKRISVVTK